MGRLLIFLRACIFAALLFGGVVLPTNGMRFQEAHAATAQRRIGQVRKDTAIYRVQGGKLRPIGRLRRGEKVIILKPFKNGKILAVRSKKYKGFVSAKVIHELRQSRGDSSGASASAAAENADSTQQERVQEVWEDSTEVGDLITNKSGFRFGVDTAFSPEFGLGVGVPFYYGISLETRRVEFASELYLFFLNAGKPLRLEGQIRYLWTFWRMEVGPEAFAHYTYLLPLNRSGSGYGGGLSVGIRLTNWLQLNFGARVDFNGGIRPLYWGGFHFGL